MKEFKTAKEMCQTCNGYNGEDVHKSPRCYNCPDRKDLILKLSGKTTFHRGFNPTVRGYEEIGTAVKSTSVPEKPKVDEKLKVDRRDCDSPGCDFSCSRNEVHRYFSRSAKSLDGYMRICKKCQSNRIKSGHRNRKARAEKKKKTEKVLSEVRTEKTVTKKPDSFTLVTIDFAGHEDLLKKLRKAAKSEFRTTENQILYAIDSLLRE